MKKQKSQIVVAVVCGILGFLLAYQYKEYALQNQSKGTDYSTTEILAEIEGLKKEKESLTKSNEELNKQLKNLEESATTEGDVEKEIKKQLDVARMQLGLLDAKGPGINITMSLKSNMFGSNNSDTISGETPFGFFINTSFHTLHFYQLIFYPLHLYELHQLNNHSNF